MKTWAFAKVSETTSVGAPRHCLKVGAKRCFLNRGHLPQSRGLTKGGGSPWGRESYNGLLQPEASKLVELLGGIASDR